MEQKMRERRGNVGEGRRTGGKEQREEQVYEKKRDAVDEMVMSRKERRMREERRMRQEGQWIGLREGGRAVDRGEGQGLAGVGHFPALGIQFKLTP